MVYLEDLVAERSQKRCEEPVQHILRRIAKTGESFVPMVVDSYDKLVQEAARASTKKYFNMLREVYKEQGFAAALRFDAHVTVERHSPPSYIFYELDGN